MTIKIDTKEVLSNISSKLEALATKTYSFLKTEKVLDVPTCSPLFRDSVKFSHLRKIEKETSKTSELNEITYQKQKILKSYSSSQLDKMREIIKYLESNEK